MAIYLKQFETQAAYEAAESGLILPNVSLTLDNNAVHYKPSSPVPPTPSHDYVEISGVKWATMNVGANSITDTGLYFQWGDTQGYTTAQVGSGEGQKYFDDGDYKYFSGVGTSSFEIIKYNETDEKAVLEESDDAVIANWGGSWRMPTVSEYDILCDAVTTAWTQVDGVYGILCTDKTDSSKTLFFPACGFCYKGNVSDVGSEGYYWSSSLNSDCEYNMSYTLSLTQWTGVVEYRCYGLPVRGILDE